MQQQVDIKQFKSHQIPEHAFIMMVAARRKGKTQLAKWVYRYLQNKFDKTFVICKGGASGAWDEIGARVFRRNPAEALQAIVEAQEVMEETEGIDRVPRVCLILDDIVSALKRQDDILETLALGGRHRKITVIMLVQRYRYFSPTIRDNIDLLMVFRGISKGTAVTIVEEAAYALGLTQDTFDDIYFEVAQHYRVLVIAKSEDDSALDEKFFWIEAFETDDSK